MTEESSSDLQALLRAVGRLARVGPPPSQPQGGPRKETQQLSEVLSWADRTKHPPGMLLRHFEAWGIQNRARDLLTSGITSSEKAAERDFETA